MRLCAPDPEFLALGSAVMGTRWESHLGENLHIHDQRAGRRTLGLSKGDLEEKPADQWDGGPEEPLAPLAGRSQVSAKGYQPACDLGEEKRPKQTVVYNCEYAEGIYCVTPRISAHYAETLKMLQTCHFPPTFPFFIT